MKQTMSLSEFSCLSECTRLYPSKILPVMQDNKNITCVKIDIIYILVNTVKKNVCLLIHSISIILFRKFSQLFIVYLSCCWLVDFGLNVICIFILPF